MPEKTVILSSELTAAHVEKLEASLSEALTDEVERLVLDFGQVCFVDSVGLSLLISLHGLLQQRGGRLRGINLSPELMQLFTSMRLDRHFDLQAADHSK